MSRPHRFSTVYLFLVLPWLGCGTPEEGHVSALQDDLPTHAATSGASIASGSIELTATPSASEIAVVKASGLCMEVVGSSAANGAAVMLNACNGSAAQSWTHTQGRMKIFGNKCLDVPNGTNVAGTKLQIWDCINDDTAQQWAHQDNTYVWSAGQKCVDIPAGNAAIGTHLQIWNCNGTMAQKWQSQMTSTIRPPSAPTKCLTVAGGSATNGAHVQIADCNASPAQLWTFANDTLRVFGTKCLEVPGGVNANGTLAKITDCVPGGLTQIWGLSHGALSWFLSGKCLNLPSGSPADGTPVDIQKCNSGSNQTWLAAFAQASTSPSPTPSRPTPLPTPSGPKPSPAFLPSVSGTCPNLTTGNATFLGQNVRLWAPSAPSSNGSLVLYWHGTGGQPSEALSGLGQTQINDIVAKGGMVAAFTATNGKGQPTVGNHVWYTGDFTTADEVVACAIRDLKIDPRRIYTMGESAGGLHCTWMAYARSGYLAAVAPISGGLLGQNGRWSDPTSTPQDPSNVPFAMVTHGAKGVDVYVPANFDFANASAEYEGDIANKNGMSIDCNTGRGHVSGPPLIGPSIWKFFEDHPFKASPEPYGHNLPSSFPSYCKIGPVPF